MSIIQDIRDKYARISVIAIALALIGFILTDYVRGKDRGRSAAGSNSVGTVNGHTISKEEFAKSVEQSEAGMKKQGYPEAYIKQQGMEQAWTQQVNRVILSDEFDKLGMRIGKRERGDILFGPNAPDEFRSMGTDPKTKIYDPLRAKQGLDQLMKEKDPNRFSQTQKDGVNDYIKQLELQRKSEKYGAMFTNSANYPRWFVEKQTADNSLIGKISMVKVFYTDSAFVDSTIKISDKEIENYLGKHKEDYKQEESRSINYVTFSAEPTAEDSVFVMNEAVKLKAEYDTIKDISTILAGHGSPEPPPSIYNLPSELPAVAKDSIVKLPVNGVYGPYLDGPNYTLAKVVEIKMLPDSIKCRHVLISTNVDEGGLEDSIASKKIDSIKNAIEKTGAPWAAMVQKYNPLSDGSRSKNGEMTFSSSQVMQGMESGNFAKEFGQFVLFDGKPGEKKVVKTSFGWHYIEILTYYGSKAHYKVAYLNQEIVASQQTDGDASQAATIFAGDSRDQKSFDETFEKMPKSGRVNKGIGANIKPGDAQVQGLGLSRPFVKNIYSAKLGEVMKPERVGDAYVVAVVTEVLKEGIQSVVKARPFVEQELRKKKKAEMLKQKAGTITTLEGVAATWGKPVVTADSLRMKGGNPSAQLGYEPRVNGATFNPANKGKLVAEVLEGINGVYVIRVENISATPAAAGSTADQRKKMYEDSKRAPNKLIEALTKAATIKDKRADVY